MNTQRDCQMHELSLCQSILNIINDSVSGKNCRSIKKIALEIGQLTAVDHAALSFSFDVIKKGTIAENAILEIIEVEGWAICEFCQKAVRLKHYYEACQTCGNFSLTVTQGEELRVKFMEIE